MGLTRKTLQQPWHQQGTGHDPQARATVIDTQQQTAMARVTRAQPCGQQSTGHEHQGTGNTSQQALHQQGIRIGKESAQGHEHGGHQSPAPQQLARTPAAQQARGEQRTDEVAQRVRRVHGAGQGVGPAQVGAHRGQQQPIGKTGNT